MRYRDNSLLVDAKETITNYDPKFLDVQTYLSYKINSKFELSFLGNIASNVYNYAPKTRQTNFGTLENPVALLVFYEGQEQDAPSRAFRITSFYGEEKEILSQFNSLIERHFKHPKFVLCAHNGKEFDFPYIARRMIINKMKLPSKLNLFGKKPWEVPHLDTLDLWKFGDYKHYTSLKLMTNVLGIPSPKDDIDGSEVYGVFYKENNIERIINYCEKDTLAVAQILLRLRGEMLLDKAEIAYI